MIIDEHGYTYTKCKCPSCECKFRYTGIDVKWATWSNDYFKYVKCPECGHIIREESWLNGLWC